MTLTKKEIIIATWLVDGYSQREIASKMDRAVATVYCHVKNMRRKLNAESTAQLVRILRDLPHDAV